MHELMHEGVFHMFLIEEISLAKHNCAGLGGKSTRTGEVARKARHVGRVAVHASEPEMLEHKLYRWAYNISPVSAQKKKEYWARA
jgi:hypothetical protein